MHSYDQPGRTRDLRALGVSRRALGGPRWESPTHGVHVPAGRELDLWRRCRPLPLAFPDDGCFSHLTGAGLRGWWLPESVDPADPIIVSTPSSTAHLDRRGFYARRLLLPVEDRQRVVGLPVASPAHLMRELAEDLSLVDLVVALDSALHAGDLTAVELPRLARPRRRGVRTLRAAIALCDGRSESAWETILRLVHVLSGLTQVVPQHVLLDAWGEPVARADLWLRGTNRIHEYDGADHRSRNRHRADLGRDKRLSRLGVERYGYTRAEIVHAADAIVRDAERAFGLPAEVSRVEGWLSEFRLSSISGPGRSRLQRRLRRFRRPDPPRSVQAPAPRRVAQE